MSPLKVKCKTRKEIDQRGHLQSMVQVFTVHIIGRQGLFESLMCAHSTVFGLS